MNEREGQDPLERFFSEEEHRNLISIFSGSYEGAGGQSVENPQELNTWKVEERFDTSSSKNEQRFILTKGLMSFDFSLYPDGEILRWAAVVPQQLLPNQSAADFYSGFEDTVLYRTPDRVGYRRTSTMQDVVTAYKNGSEATITSRAGETNYDFSKKENYLQFALDFCRGKDPIESLRVRVKTSSSSGPAYLLAINYPRRFEEVGVIGIYVPRRYNIDSWSPSFATWALGTQAYKQSEDSGDLASANFSAILTSLVPHPSGRS